MPQLTLNYFKVSVLINRRTGPDLIYIRLKDKTAFPNLPDCQATATIETQKGLGVDWCRNVLGVEPEIVDAQGCA